ncbi:MAG: hypothetical protein M5U08_21370 [Burkholderiales bacterium]|nr:hypothetical protein [Burkholderiales bacterium]
MEQTLAQSDITIRPGSQADLTRMEGMETWRDIDVYRDWLARGRHLLIAEERGEIVSYSWQDFGEQFVIEQVPELRYRLSEDACYGDESYTPVAHRGRGLRRLLFVAERQLARARGRRFVVAYFMSKRAAEDALRNFERLGVPRGVALHEVVLWNFGGLRIASARALAEDRTIRCLD